MDLLALVLGESAAGEGDAAQPVGRVGMGPDAAVGAEFEMLGEPLRHRIVPALEADDDSVVPVGLGEERVEKARRRLEVEALHRHDQDDGFLRPRAVAPEPVLPPSGEGIAKDTEGRDEDQQQPGSPECQQAFFNHENPCKMGGGV